MVQPWFENRYKRFLLIAEKPSQLKALSAVLPKASNICLESLRGHCLGLVDLAAYGDALSSSWLHLTQQRLVPYIPQQFIRRPLKSNKKYNISYKDIIERVGNIAEEVDAIVLACDPDNEGMALGVELLEYLGVAHKVIGAINTSKLDGDSLREAVRDVDSLNWRAMANAGMARAEYDWSLGINATILASVQLGQGETLHVGGVKLPTLRCVVERERAIAAHQTEFYYTVQGRARHEQSGAEFDFEVKVDRHSHLSKKTADVVRAHLHKLPNCSVTDYVEKLGLEQSPPKPFSLADLQSEASLKLHKPPGMTLKLAQQLYESGYISYPRTDCRYYAQGQMKEVPRIVENLRKQSDFSSCDFPKPLRASTMIFQDKKVSAHTALSVTNKALGKELRGVEVYKLVATRYAIQFMRKFGYNSYALLCEPRDKGQLKSTHIQLFSSENVVTEMGWKQLYNESCGISSVQHRTLPEARQGDTVRVLYVDVKKHQTEPPHRFTEATLLKAMERINSIYPELKGQLKNGIGTPATRSKIIEDLLKDGYLEHRRGAATIYPTELAFKAIDTLPESLSNVARRASLESRLDAISRTQLNPEQFKHEFSREIKQSAADIAAIAQEKGYKPSGKKRSSAPSAKQLAYAGSLAKRLKVDVPPSAKASSKEISTWISEHKDIDSGEGQRRSMFSEKQKDIVLSNCQDERILSLLTSQDHSDYKTVSNWIGGFLSQQKGKPRAREEPKIVVELAK